MVRPLLNNASHTMVPGRDTLRRIVDDTSGAAFVEYVAILLLVSVISAAATYSLGQPFVQYFKFAETILGIPFP